jgi:hypothetical protein
VKGGAEEISREMDRKLTQDLHRKRLCNFLS